MSFLRRDINKILIEIQNGDKTKMNELCERYLEHFSYIARKYISDRDEIDDVLAESFIKAFKYIKSFDAEKDGYNWLYKIVENTALTHNKNKKKTVPLEIVDRLFVDESFEDRIIAKQEVEDLLSDYEELDQKMIIGHYVENKSLNELAKELNIHRSTIYKRLRKMTTKMLKKHDKK